ncbi:unnamed protein product [Phaedon cochleariae]|uniref:Uncharacterized protein n=1 Tax=Phaedon cochleariae TaxID=80249 RepID=A0A9P0DE81_PHACE|nr:unnamed protein product [Phaedon cochleariae]
MHLEHTACDPRSNSHLNVPKIVWCEKNKTINRLGMFLESIIIILIFTCGANWCDSVSDNSYSFKYVIDTSGILSQHLEERDKERVRGSYSFLQPDGQIRIVQYEIENGSGFKAFVSYRKLFSGTLMGHLRYPKDFREPVVLATPVSLITSELFQIEDIYVKFKT